METKNNNIEVAEPMMAVVEGANPSESGEANRPLSAGQTFWYSVANLGYGMFYALNNFVLPLLLKKFTNNNVLIGLMSSSDSIEGVVVQPWVGSASDRLRSRLGRRRPFLLYAIPPAALLILLTPVAGHLPQNAALAVMVGCIILFTVLFNIAWSPYLSLMPDITPEAQRGRVTAVMTLFGLVGQAALLLAPIDIPAKFGLAAAVMLVTTLLTCLFIREPEQLPLQSGSHNPLQEAKEALGGLQILKQARKAMLVIFWNGVGIGAILPFLTVFIQDITKCTDAQALQMSFVLMISAALTVLPFGKLTDTIGPKRVLMLGSAIIVVASVAALWIHTLSQVAVIMVIAGLGNAAQSAARYPLLTELVPAEEVGFYTGLQKTAESLAMPLTSILTGVLINQGGYRVIFAICAASILIGMFFLALIQLRQAKAEIAARDREQGRGGEPEPC